MNVGNSGMTAPESVVRLGMDKGILDALMTKTPAPHPAEDHPDAQLSAELQGVFGQSVRTARMKAGLTQAELATRSGVAREDVSRIENGQINLTIRTMTRLAAVFDGDVAAMLKLAKGQTIKPRSE